MGRNRLPCLTSLVLVAFLWSTACWAGANVGGSASLSWAVGSSVTNLSVAPSHNRVPLFLRLQNAPDIQQLAIHVEWTPNNLFGPCYYVVPDSTLAASCGWTAAEPGGDFEGDASYSWSIRFPPGSDRTCVTYWVSGGHCDTVAADFLVTKLLTMDSNGVVDTLEAVNFATILGGTSAGELASVQSVAPRYLLRGQENTLTIRGNNFEPGAQVTLRGSGGDISAPAVLTGDAQTLTATLAIPQTAAGSLDVEVDFPGGQTATAENAVVAGDIWWGMMVDGTTAYTGRAGDGVPIYQYDVATGEVWSPEASTSYSQTCNNIPFCSIPLFGAEFRQPTVAGPSTGCKLASRPSSTDITYFFCYGAPCFPGDEDIVRNLPLELKQFARQKSGGHCHADTSRPAGTPRNGAIVSGNTGPNGLQFVVHYDFPQVSGALNQVLYTPAGQDTFVFNSSRDTTSILCLRWAELTQLTGPGPGYKLQAPGADNLQNHPDYRWGIPRMVDSLKTLAIAIRDTFPGLPDVEYNDISLVWGGLFDILDTPGTPRPPFWTRPHCTHHTGSAVDFRTRHISWASDSTLASRMMKLMRRKGFSPKPEGDHWHLKFLK